MSRKNIDNQARTLMSRDFLCPSEDFLWARFRVALANWIEMDPKNTQKLLSSLIDESEGMISYTKSPNEPESIGIPKLKDVVCPIFEVDPDWLVEGYNKNFEAWPTWLDSSIEDGRQVIKEIVIALLRDTLQHQYTRHTRNEPWTCSDNPESLVPDNEFAISFLRMFREKTRNYLAEKGDDPARTIIINLLDRRIYPNPIFDNCNIPMSIFDSENPLFLDLRYYVEHHKLSVSDYLSRYQKTIGKIWADLVVEALEPKQPESKTGKVTAHEQLLCWVAVKMGFTRVLHGVEGNPIILPNRAMWRPSLDSTPWHPNPIWLK